MIKASFFYRGFIFLAFATYIICFVIAVISMQGNYWDEILKALTTPISFTIFIAFFAVAFGLENYLRKTDLDISGRIEIYNYAPKKSGYSYDTSIVSFQLNNYKDKTVVIYKVYLRLDENLYIELLDATKEPILLKAYDTYLKKLEKTLYYQKDNKPILIKNINLTNSNIYLDTNEGRYKVKKKIENWAPKKENTLIPITTTKEYEFDVKFYIQENSPISLQPTIYAVNFDQEIIKINGKNVNIKNIENVEELKGLLEKETPNFGGYSVWSPMDRIVEQYPNWIIASNIDDKNNFINYLIGLRERLLGKFRQ